MTAFGDYEQSYPPEILRGYTPPLVGATARLSAATGGTFTITAGEPGTYSPEVVAADRPRNVTELRERARPADTGPWPEGAYVLVGTSGKRAHWGGDDWHGGESPGYPEPEPEPSRTTAATDVESRRAAPAADDASTSSSEPSPAAGDDASTPAEDDATGDDDADDDAAEPTKGGSDPA